MFQCIIRNNISLTSVIKYLSGAFKMSKKRPHSGMPATAAKKGHWSQGLKQSMADPEMIVEQDDRIVIIKDKYPKARYHFLVMPKEDLASLKHVKKEHLELLKYMERRGKELAEKTNKDVEFRFGYHAVPSMSHLHMHVISQDFDSPSLKTKKHWNSFTTKYFVDSSKITEELENKGCIEPMPSKEAEALLKQDLRCHICDMKPATIPKLKEHLQKHFPK